MPRDSESVIRAEGYCGIFMMFRIENDPEDRWCTIKQDGFQSQAFDQPAFEDTVKALLG